MGHKLHLIEAAPAVVVEIVPQGLQNLLLGLGCIKVLLRHRGGGIHQGTDIQVLQRIIALPIGHQTDDHLSAGVLYGNAHKGGVLCRHQLRNGANQIGTVNGASLRKPLLPQPLVHKLRYMFDEIFVIGKSRFYCQHTGRLLCFRKPWYNSKVSLYYITDYTFCQHGRRKKVPAHRRHPLCAGIWGDRKQQN